MVEEWIYNSTTLGKIFQKNNDATALLGKWPLGHADKFNPEKTVVPGS